MQIAAPAPKCAGTWTQQWQCGWDKPVSPAVVHAGQAAGHAGGAILIALAVVLVLVVMAKAGRRRSPVTSK